MKYEASVSKELIEDYDSWQFYFSDTYDITPRSKHKLALVIKLQASGYWNKPTISYATYCAPPYEVNEWTEVDYDIYFRDMNVDGISDIYNDCGSAIDYIREDTDDEDDLVALDYFAKHGRDRVLYIGVPTHSMYYVGKDDGDGVNNRYTVENVLQVIKDETDGRYNDITLRVTDERGMHKDFYAYHTHESSTDEAVKDLISDMKHDLGITDDDELIIEEF